MAIESITLDDKYTLEKGRIHVSGTQALVRLLMLQQQIDAKNGLNTSGFISGYRGSPLGNVDKELWRAEKHLKRHNIHFEPGVNEDLAATAIWGTQQTNMFPKAKFDGTFAMWYGKGPGVDRSGDVFKHGNLAGTSPHGGVLVVAGDDPACKSSTAPSQSEYPFMAAQIPTLAPANVQEFIDFGVLGYAMSRFSGAWVGMKTVTENVETTSSVVADPERIKPVIPTDFEMPKGGPHIRWPDPAVVQEVRMRDVRIPAALAFAKANGLDRVAIDAPKATFGIVTAGKSYLDVMQALHDLGITEETAKKLGVKVYKVGMIWPLEETGMTAFAKGCKEILVVEEKRPVIEVQMKDALYYAPQSERPLIVGKKDENGKSILPPSGELSPEIIARVIAKRLGLHFGAEKLEGLVSDRIALIDAKEKASNVPSPGIARMPYFCSGCPHNTSTKVPDGSRAVAGIGCHFMAVWMDRNTATFTHMGGEGANWIGQAPFTDEEHIFVNLGDGTYYHSGLLAIRAAVAADVTMTYKILYNDAVAMTGGQPHDGPLTPQLISKQVASEGVKRIAVVTDDPAQYGGSQGGFAPFCTFHHRDEMDALQKELRRTKGVSALIYVQTCAAEKRRRRKRNLYPDPPKRAFINDMVCEGCGDCGIQSNCVSIEPIETTLGRKRMINQSSCNKDFTCVDGFCPSFVTVHNGTPRKKAGTGNTAKDAGLGDPPPATLPNLDEPYGLILTGIGGTGVVTIGALLAMAAHMEGKGVSVFDLTGLAQKNGPVVSQLKIAAKPEDIYAVRVGPGGAKAVIGCDMVTAGGVEALSKMDSTKTRAVINSHQTVTAEFTKNKDFVYPDQALRDAINSTCSDTDFVEATALATSLLGDAIATNLFMVGYAWQKGLIPLSVEAIERAVELNGVAVEFNKKAFMWGRRAAHEPEKVRQIAHPKIKTISDKKGEDLEEIVAYRANYLVEYQNQALADKYRALVERVRVAEERAVKGSHALAEAVARNYFKLLAIKDEYEVARLHSSQEFQDKLNAQFDGDFKLTFHLAPPLLAKRDPNTGHLIKQEFGGWMMSAFKWVAKLKGLRGSPLDIFGYSAERKTERALIVAYEKTINELLSALTPSNHGLATDIAKIPADILGFGHVKEKNIRAAQAKEADLLQRFRSPDAPLKAAE